MYAEIIASGTELLMGETQDTNSGYLASQLPSLGLELRQISLVGDDLNDYTEVLERAWLRANFTFTTGGLGPTSDDVTREAIARVLQEDIYIDNEQLDVLKNMFKSRGTEMPLRNIKQAGLIPSAFSIPNPLGTAPGWWVEKGNQVIIALPGPPRELEAMWINEVAPRLKNRIKGSVVLTKTLKTTGLSEARVDEMAAPVLDNINPYVGVYAKPDGIHIRIISKASNEKEAVRLLNAVDKKLQVIFSTSIWGIDSDAAEDMVGKLLTKGNMTLATMESCTGGMLADTITNVSGSSNYYQGGFVSYTNELKIALGLPSELIQKHGVVSGEVAQAMAEMARVTLGADFGIGVTGIAGPEWVNDMPPGTVYIGLASTSGTESSLHRLPGSNRTLVKRRAVISALLALLVKLHKAS